MKVFFYNFAYFFSFLKQPSDLIHLLWFIVEGDLSFKDRGETHHLIHFGIVNLLLVVGAHKHFANSLEEAKCNSLRISSVAHNHESALDIEDIEHVATCSIFHVLAIITSLEYLVGNEWEIA